MKVEFRRGKPDEVPTEGKDDELLAEIPEGAAVPSSMDGYRSGARMRWFLFGGLVLATIGIGIGAHEYIEYLEEQAKIVRPNYVVDEDAASRAVREIHWGDGRARLALSREPPGVEVIVLPDREIRLADGHDHAQVNITVSNGRTVKLKVLSGKIVQTPTAAPKPASPASSP